MSEALELLRCAQINFDNLIQMLPGIATMPFYKIARMQLDQGIAQLEGETP
jgi:hypothetical protein